MSIMNAALNFMMCGFDQPEPIDWQAKREIDNQHARFMGMKCTETNAVPSGQVWLVQDNKIVGKIINIEPKA